MTEFELARNRLFELLEGFDKAYEVLESDVITVRFRGRRNCYLIVALDEENGILVSTRGTSGSMSEARIEELADRLNMERSKGCFSVIGASIYFGHRCSFTDFLSSGMDVLLYGEQELDKAEQAFLQAIMGVVE